MKLGQFILILEQHFEESSPPLEHFIESILKSWFELGITRIFNPALLLLLLVLSIPHVVSNKLLDLLSLFGTQFIFAYFASI